MYPSLFYRWKEIRDIYGVDALRSGTRHSDQGTRKLKKMLAENELEVSISSGSI